MSKQHNSTPEGKRQESRYVSREVYDNAQRYFGNVGQGLFVLDALVIKMYQEEVRRHQAANVGGQVMYAQAAEQRDKVAVNVAPTAIADTAATAATVPEMAENIEDAASEFIAEAQRAVQDALQGTANPDQGSVGLAA